MQPSTYCTPHAAEEAAPRSGVHHSHSAGHPPVGLQLDNALKLLRLELGAVEELARSPSALAEHVALLQELVARVGEHIPSPEPRDDGLEAAIRSSVELASAGTHARVDVILQCDDVTVAPLHASLLHGVILEALRHAIEHADARHVRIMLHCRDRQLVALVLDDGEGVSPSSAPPRRRTFEQLRRRVRAAGGTLRLRTGAERGSVLVASIPVGAPAAGQIV